MLAKVLIEQTFLELINRLLVSIGQTLEPCPDQRCRLDVVALCPGQPALRLLCAGELFLLPVKLLDAPSQAAHIFDGLNVVLRCIVGDDVVRAVGRHLNPE